MIEDDVLVTHRAVVATLPAGIRADFETDADRWQDRLARMEAGELWLLPPVPTMCPGNARPIWTAMEPWDIDSWGCTACDGHWTTRPEVHGEGKP